jgi:ATP-dependent phosphoenolpyruvate carboxykinase
VNTGLERRGLWHRQVHQAGTNTRAIIDAIHSGAFVKAKTERDPVFGFDVVTESPNVPAGILIPRNFWAVLAISMVIVDCFHLRRRIREYHRE